jgi:hypothetical protein
LPGGRDTSRRVRTDPAAGVRRAVVARKITYGRLLILAWIGILIYAAVSGHWADLRTPLWFLIWVLVAMAGVGAVVAVAGGAGALGALLDPTSELIIGCVCLVVSGWWWFSARGAIWHGWQNIVAAFATVVGPVLVYRAWKRRAEDVDESA